MSVASMVQVNIRMERELKERGDATLNLVGSSPAKIIRQLWKCLATGGDAYERVVTALSPAREDATADGAYNAVRHSASMFQELGATIGADITVFAPDLRDEHELLEGIEWELLARKELA